MKPSLNAIRFNALKLYELIPFLKFLDDIAKNGFTLKKAAEKPILKMNSRVVTNSLSG